jgi:O-antigen ligase
MGLLVIWTGVGYLNYGLNGSFTRELVRGTSILVIALVASASVRRMSDMNRLVAIIVGATVLEAVIATVQWVLGSDPSGRARGTFAHPNTAAAAFSLALALCFWKLLDRRSKVYIGAAILLAIGLLATRSLGGLAQMIATLLAYTVLARGAGRRLAIKALVFGVVVIGVFSLTSIGQSRVQQLQNTQTYSNSLQGADQQNSLAWRFGHWGLELKEWRVHPFFGFGAGATAKIVQPQGKIPHSDYLRFLVETGVFGTLAFGAAFLLIVAAIYRRARAPGEVGQYATALMAIIVGLAVRASEENITTQTAVMYVVAVLIGGLFGLAPQFARSRATRARGMTA